MVNAQLLRPSFYTLLLLTMLTSCGTLHSTNRRSFVTPEIFGAKGDGVVDDTDALKKAFSTGMDVILEQQYRVSKSLNLKSSLSGGGTILFDRDGISINCVESSISVRDIIFDYQRHYGRMVRLNGVTNVTFDSCSFLNVGNLDQKFANGMVVISDGCTQINIKGCKFAHCYSSPMFSSQGIWIQQKNKHNHHIYVSDCVFDDFQTIEDADAIKVLGGDYDSFLYVNNCEFRKCAKRAMKFQGRECHSSNNKIYVTEPMHCAIAFQRGFGSSTNDTIILNYDGRSKINPDSGLLYRVITISQGNVSIDGFYMEDRKTVQNSHQAVIGIVSYDANDMVVSNVSIKNSHFLNGGSFLKASNQIDVVNKLYICNSDFTVLSNTPTFILYGSKVTSSDINLLLNNKADYIVRLGVENIDKKNNKILIKKNSRIINGRFYDGDDKN